LISDALRTGLNTGEVNLKQISFEFASGSNLGPSFQIALNSYPVLARRTPQSRSPAQGQETELRILAGIGDRMVEEGAGYRDRFPSTLSRQVP
jgi:hypothetical protein